MKPKSPQSIQLYNIMLRLGYPEEFADIVTKNLNTDFTATRMMGYLYRYSNPRLEDVADEMLAILDDRNRIMEKKELEEINKKWNEFLHTGIPDEDEKQMPFINSKISVALTDAQEQEIKARLGQAITAIPGKSESWLMVGFEPEYKLYFRGSNDQPMAMVEVSVYGSENPSAFSKLTGEICKIFEDVLGIAPDHVYVKYQAVANWGWNGGNF